MVLTSDSYQLSFIPSEDRIAQIRPTGYYKPGCQKLETNLGRGDHFNDPEELPASRIPQACRGTLVAADRVA